MTIHADHLNDQVIFKQTEDLSKDLSQLLQEYIIPFSQREQEALRVELAFRVEESKKLKTVAEAFIQSIRDGIRQSIKNKQNEYIALFPDDENRAFLSKLDFYGDKYYLTDGSYNTNPLFSDLEQFGKNCCKVYIEPYQDCSDSKKLFYETVGVRVRWEFEYSTAYYLLKKRAS